MRVEKMRIAELRAEVLHLRFKRHEQKKAFRAQQHAILEKNVQILHLQTRVTALEAQLPREVKVTDDITLVEVKV